MQYKAVYEKKKYFAVCEYASVYCPGGLIIRGSKYAGTPEGLASPPHPHPTPSPPLPENHFGVPELNGASGVEMKCGEMDHYNFHFGNSENYRWVWNETTTCQIKLETEIHHS